eukprot:7094993-Ditylum_brightwellii.AAC.1
MITAPALGEFTREVDKFHTSKNSKNPKCDLTFTARKKLIMAIFGQHVTNIEPFWNDMGKEHPRIEGKIYTSTLVSWRIACCGGCQVEVAKKAAIYDGYD